MVKRLLLALLLCIPAFGATSNSGLITSGGANCNTATNCVILQLQPSNATAVVTLSGTFSATVQFELSADGTNFVAANAQPQPSGASVSSATAAGTWVIPVSGMTTLRARSSSFSSGQVNVFLQATQALTSQPTVSIANVAGTTDPCQNPAVTKSSAKITLTSTTAQEVVTLVSGKIIYVCGFSATIQGSATTVGTLQFEYGTKTTNGCDTGTATLTDVFQGNITASVPTLITSAGGGFTQFATAASNELCAVATGTTISVKGYLTYVQQ